MPAELLAALFAAAASIVVGVGYLTNYALKKAIPALIDQHIKSREKKGDAEHMDAQTGLLMVTAINKLTEQVGMVGDVKISVDNLRFAVERQTKGTDRLIDMIISRLDRHDQTLEANIDANRELRNDVRSLIIIVGTLPEALARIEALLQRDPAPVPQDAEEAPIS